MSFIFVIVGYSQIINTFGNISQWNSILFFFNTGVIRALAGMSLGVIAYKIIYPYLSKKNIFSLIVLWCMCILAIFSLVYFRDIITMNDMIFYSLIFSLFIALNYSFKIRFPIFLEKIILLLGKASFPIFIFHSSIIQVLDHYYPNGSYFKMSIIMLAIVISLSLCINFIFEKIKKIHA